MTYARSWERLLEGLTVVGAVTEVAPGRIQIACGQSDGDPRSVEIVMTRGNWEDMSSVAWGDVDGAAAYVAQRVRTSDQPFLVYDDEYDLQGCPTAEIPEDPEEARMRELMRQHQEGIPGGRWVAYDRDGNAADVHAPETSD